MRRLVQDDDWDEDTGSIRLRSEYHDGIITVSVPANARFVGFHLCAAPKAVLLAPDCMTPVCASLLQSMEGHFEDLESEGVRNFCLITFTACRALPLSAARLASRHYLLRCPACAYGLALLNGVVC